MATLNRDLPIPLYHQLKTLILQEIEAGRWQPDQQLPTEEQLSARFRVSKITVRQALRELANLGWVRREQGRGTFVQKPALEEGPRKLTGFTAEMRDHGLNATSQVLDKGVIPAPADVAAKLRIAPNDHVFCLRRLRLADGMPLGVQTAYLPFEMLPGIDEVPFTNVSLYGLLESRYDLHPVSAKETLIAVVVGRAKTRTCCGYRRVRRRSQPSASLFSRTDSRSSTRNRSCAAIATRLFWISPNSPELSTFLAATR
jgi:GntR family transcriptional regulator